MLQLRITRLMWLSVLRARGRETICAEQNMNYGFHVYTCWCGKAQIFRQRCHYDINIESSCQALFPTMMTKLALWQFSYIYICLYDLSWTPSKTVVIIRACACWALIVATLTATTTIHYIYITIRGLYIYIYIYMYMYIYIYIYTMLTFT